ncbi:MAG TPA: hypothetical protein VK183_00070 [Flavobacterium sp.]|nr:hypothetical protein [Flavobacterium sp.]
MTKPLMWCVVLMTGVASFAQNALKANLDLTNVVDDKVKVTVSVPKITTDKITYFIPKTVPGTYSEDDFGKYIDDLKAVGTDGKPLVVEKADANSWTIVGAKKLAKITYLVNDTFDIEGKHDVFSPVGSNIDANKNFMVNTQAFVGYFKEFMETPYEMTVAHPAGLWGATSMTDLDASPTADRFTVSRYAELVENPIMYSKPDHTEFQINGMDILIAVYSPNGAITAEAITPDLKEMMTAQKNFLGNFNSTKKYSILIYLSTLSETDAKGFGALEHPTCTTVVMPESMGVEGLGGQLRDVVSHEFFHIVTPLTIHSKEIQYFDFNAPKMSKHLWMYEGVTEYFANLFQVNQGLISEQDFLDRMTGKIENASRMNDKMSFTTMSQNVLVQPYKDQYVNVYEKGALIGMCIDIIIREKSNGQRGILDMMQRLSAKYGVGKPFEDEALFAEITQMTYPEVGAFLDKYVAGETPIPYSEYFAKMGVVKGKYNKKGMPLLKDMQTPYIGVNPKSEIYFLPDVDNAFAKNLGIEGNDVLLEANGTAYNVNNIYDLVMASMGWKEGDAVTVKIRRGTEEKTVSGKVVLPSTEEEGYNAAGGDKQALRNAWLKG